MHFGKLNPSLALGEAVTQSFVFIGRVACRVSSPLNLTNDTDTLFTFFVTAYLDIWWHIYLQGLKELVSTPSPFSIPSLLHRNLFCLV